MIFYFSGSGNSLWVAKEFGIFFEEPPISIAEELLKESEELVYSIGEEEMIYFIYPVHSWGIPLLVNRFISRLRFEGYTNQEIYSVSTCGDECGHTDRIFRESLAKRGMSLTDAFSIRMPNNYILLPGFDVDPEEVEYKKHERTHNQISTAIYNTTFHSRFYTQQYIRGSFPLLKSRIIYPLFLWYIQRPNKFYATDACTACGLCKEKCPTGTIRLQEDGKPLWEKKGCVQCLACIHYCPARAIEYGKSTRKKGRYRHPQKHFNYLRR